MLTKGRRARLMSVRRALSIKMRAPVVVKVPAAVCRGADDDER
jgi:hypothetical protein